VEKTEGKKPDEKSREMKQVRSLDGDRRIVRGYMYYAPLFTLDCDVILLESLNVWWRGRKARRQAAVEDVLSRRMQQIIGLRVTAIISESCKKLQVGISAWYISCKIYLKTHIAMKRGFLRCMFHL